MAKSNVQNNVDQEVINFTAVYTHTSPQSLDNSTILAEIGIITDSDRIKYLVELEERFGLIYEPGDQNGVYTIGDAVKLIESKLPTTKTP
jgi:acyl carrier protein